MAACLDFDDGFDDDSEDERRIREIEWSRNRDARVKEGYVDGLTEGQDSRLQQGFNEGYGESAKLAAEVARIKGAVCALLSYGLTRNNRLLTSAAEKDFQELMSSISDAQVKYLRDYKDKGVKDKDSSIDVFELKTAKRNTDSSDLINDIDGVDDQLALTDGSHVESSEDNNSVKTSIAIRPSLVRTSNQGETTFDEKSDLQLDAQSLQCLTTEFHRLINLYNLPQLI